MKTLRLLLGLLVSLGALGTAQAQARYYRVSATIITKAEVVGGTEIDTGRYVLLAYDLFSDRRHYSDSWYTNALFVKLTSLDALPLGAAVAIPNAALTVSAYTQSTWNFEQLQHLTGTITRLAATKAGQQLQVNIHYVDRKGASQTLLKKTLLFRYDPTYFQRHRIDYHGKYDDLRLALKEPAKVKSLDLVTYAIQYEKRNVPDSGPDTLYQQLGELVNLEELNLSLSDLETLPAGMRQLKRLKKLDLSYNDLITFPSLLLELDSLQELNLKSNRLDSIPATVAQLKHLRVLNLDNNRLTHYPMSVNTLPGLQELGLSNANLRVLPDQIKQLTGLRVLRLDGFWNNPRRNQLQDVSALRSLPQLRSLSLAGNALSTLPMGVYQLSGLEELNLQDNGLDSTKVEVRYFPKLNKLIL